ncbi:MAG TPA: DNA polymerase III subunit delta' C-terminal domain-containing protein [Bacillota bacterium]|nr:DNA polymerase III subunit delta' C-terminal domain-containing protein [Bacillota bacterium]HRX91231.1 DNA polymerase III subunit delta' C-terminal domain-containing protein [Candidatus Izemoplasmatales bacterium]
MMRKMLVTWDELAGYQPYVARILGNSLKNRRLAHSYILEGPLGSKRLDTAILLAKTLLCQNLQADGNPCQACHNCRRIDDMAHPNLFYVEAESEQIRKKQVLELLQEFSRQSVEKGPRIYIVNEAEKFNQEAANTLLKTMEEPGQDLYQILITSQVNALLKTIVSRSQVLHFTPINKKQIVLELEKENLSQAMVAGISEYTDNTDKAREMAASQQTSDILELMFEIFKRLETGEKSAVMAFKEQRDAILPDPEAIDFFLTMMVLFLKDMLSHKIHYHSLIVFESEKELIGKLADKTDQEKIEAAIDQVLDLKSTTKYNINSQLAFDALLVDLERGFDHGISGSAG